MDKVLTAESTPEVEPEEDEGAATEAPPPPFDWRKDCPVPIQPRPHPVKTALGDPVTRSWALSVLTRYIEASEGRLPVIRAWLGCSKHTAYRMVHETGLAELAAEKRLLGGHLTGSAKRTGPVGRRGSQAPPSRELPFVSLQLLERQLYGAMKGIPPKTKDPETSEDKMLGERWLHLATLVRLMRKLYGLEGLRLLIGFAAVDLAREDVAAAKRWLHTVEEMLPELSAPVA